MIKKSLFLVFISICSFCNVFALDLQIVYEECKAKMDIEATVELINTANRSKNTLIEAKAHYLAAYIYSIEGNTKETSKHYSDALNLFFKINDQEQVHNILINLAAVFEKSYNFETAIELTKRAQRYYEGEKDQDKLKLVYFNLSKFFRLNSEYDSAYKYQTKTLDIALEQNDIKYCANAYNQIGLTFKSNGEYDKAIDFYFKALNITEGTKYYTSRKIKTYTSVGNSYRLKKDLNTSRYYLREALDLISTSKNVKRIVDVNYDLAITYEDLGQVDSAKHFYEQVYKNGKSLKEKASNSYYVNAVSRLSELYESEGDVQKAFLLSKESSEMLRTLTHVNNYLAENEKKVEGELVFYYLKMKEQERISEQKNKEYIKVGLLVLLFSGFISILIVRQYQRIRKKNEINKRDLEELVERF